jgi:hypothetical protein
MNFAIEWLALVADTPLEPFGEELPVTLLPDGDKVQVADCLFEGRIFLSLLAPGPLFGGPSSMGLRRARK